MAKVLLRAPFPWFGGKSQVGDIVWRRFGRVGNYVEPFAGSLATLLLRPDWEPGATETVNDKDGFIANFWRSLQFSPEATAHYADWPVNENDLHARHWYLKTKRDQLTERLEGDPEYHDPLIAGWWVWGICSWIRGGWCSSNGPWRSTEGRLLKTGGDRGKGITRQLPHLSWGRGIRRKRPDLGGGKGINRKLPHMVDRGRGILSEFETLAERLRDVRVCCGDFRRVLGPCPTSQLGQTAILLDPPYDHDTRDTSCYAVDSGSIFEETVAWCLERGADPLLRVALCGYEGAWGAALVGAGWTEVLWKASGGYGSQGSGSSRGSINAARERLWFSPACLREVDGQGELF